MTEKMKVLIVDDNRELAWFIQEVLKNAGYDASVAYDGQNAIEIFREECFDLALLDYKLPDMNGLELQQRLAEFSDAYFILMTAHGSVKSAAQAVTRKEIIGYETKPLEIGRLLNFIEQVSLRRKAERDRKQVEDALQESEKKFRTIFDNAPLLINAFDDNGRLLLWNKECEKIFGWTIEELNAHNNPLALFYPDFQVQKEVLDTVSSKPEKVFREWRPITKAGEERITSWANFKIPNGMVINIGHDITERRRSEETLKKSEAQLKEAQRIAHLGHWEYDLQTDILYWSDEIFRIYGLDRTKFTPTYDSVVVMFHPEDRKNVEEAYRTSVENRTPFDIEHRIISDEGEIRHIQERGITVYDDVDRPLRSIGTVLDITRRRQAEEVSKQAQIALELANQKLAKERDLLQRYFDAVSAFIVTLDVEGNITMLNRKGEEMLECSKHDLIGKNWFETCLPKPEAMTTVYPVFRDIMLGNLEAMGYFENEIQSASGKRHLIAWNNNYFYDKDGCISGTISIGEDISEKRRIEDELMEAKERAEAANRSKSEFLANMSHEIRTPMNSIMGFTEILTEKTTDEAHQHYLSLIKSAGKSLLTLINDILDLSKIEAGQMKISYEPVNYTSIVEEIVHIFQDKLTEKNLELILKTDPNMPEYLYLDEIRLRQILLNLVGNAVKFTESGTIIVSAQTQDVDKIQDRVDFTVSVIDTGIGIPDDQKKFIFKAFVQQKGQNYSGYGGTGLGLAITKRLVEMMGGTISVSGKEGEGANFTVVLPDLKKSNSARIYEIKREKDYSSIIFEKATILIADDVEDNRRLLSDYLKDYGFSFIEAENGEKACDLVSQHHPDLILMDIKMPVMSGRDAIQNIKAFKKTKDIPIIAVTAAAMKNLEEEIRELCEGFLIKPVRKAALIDCLMKFLKHTAEKSLAGEVAEKKTDVNSEVFCSDDLQTRQKIPELTHMLENDFLPLCNEIRETLIMKNVKQFAEKLLEAAESYNLQLLSDYSRRLHNQVQIYDVAGIKGSLADFHQLIDDLKGCVSVGETLGGSKI